MHRAAKWIKSSFDPLTFQWSKTSDVCLKELAIGWPSLEKRRYYACITMLYAILHKSSFLITFIFQPGHIL